jgi:hypothetical protein
MHRATRDEAQEVAHWLNAGSDDRCRNFLTLRERTQKHCRMARMNELMSIQGRSSFWLEPSSLAGASLQVRPLVIRTEGRAALTLVGKNEESQIYIACMSLSEAGLLNKLRQCETCEKWYLRRKGRFCSTLCRVKWHSHTDEGKRKRAEYMRDYRANPRVRARNAAPEGYHRKRGRKLHVDLKKGR